MAVTALLVGCASEPTYQRPPGSSDTDKPAPTALDQPKEPRRPRTADDHARSPGEALSRLRAILIENRLPADLAVTEDAVAHAEAIANALVTANTDLAEAFYLRGRARVAPARRSARDEEGALSDFSKALELEPTMARCLNERAVLHFRRRNYAGALVDIEAAIALSPEDDQYRSNREVIRERHSAIETARKFVTENLTLTDACGHSCSRTSERQPPIDAVIFDPTGTHAIVQHVPYPKRGEAIKGPTFTLYGLRDGHPIRTIEIADGNFFNVDAFGPPDGSSVLLRWKENLQSRDFALGGRNWSMAVDDPVPGRNMLIATGTSGQVALLVSPRGRVDLLHMLSGDVTPIPWSEEVDAIAYCDGRSLAFAGPRGIDVVSMPMGTDPTRRIPVEARVLEMTFTPDGRRIAGLGSHEIFVVDVEKGIPQWRAARPEAARRIAVSTSGRLLALVGADVTIHSAETGEITARVRVGESQTTFSSAAFSPDEAAVYVGTSQGSIVRFDLAH